MGSADKIRRQFSVTVRRVVAGGAVVKEGLAGEALRLRQIKQERDLVYLAVEVAWFGVGPLGVSYRQFALEDSEGFLVDAEPPEDYLDGALNTADRCSGGLLFGVYSDLEPARLWFDTGMPFDESGAPLLLEVPLPTPRESRRARREELMRALDAELSEATGKPEGVEALLGQVSRELGLPYKKLASGYAVRVGLPGGRGQTVVISSSGTDEDGSPLMRFTTLCAPVDPSGTHHLDFLRANPRLSYGAIGIGTVGDEEYYMLTNTQLIATADMEELLKSISYLARKGDALEAELTGGDDVR